MNQVLEILLKEPNLKFKNSPSPRCLPPFDIPRLAKLSIGKFWFKYWKDYLLAVLHYFGHNILPRDKNWQTRYHSKQDLETFNLIGNGPHNSFWSNRFHHFKLNLQIVTKKSAPCLSNIFVWNRGCAKCTKWLAKFTLGSLFVPMSSLKGWLLGDGWFH